ncbi:unnamed protein product [Mortierella alpina]
MAVVWTHPLHDRVANAYPSSAAVGGVKGTARLTIMRHSKGIRPPFTLGLKCGQARLSLPLLSRSNGPKGGGTIKEHFPLFISRFGFIAVPNHAPSMLTLSPTILFSVTSFLVSSCLPLAHPKRHGKDSLVAKQQSSLRWVYKWTPFSFFFVFVHSSQLSTLHLTLL